MRLLRNIVIASAYKMSIAMLMAMLGAVTGILSALVPLSNPYALMFPGGAFGPFWIPGLFFSPVVVLGMWLTTRRGDASLAAVPITIFAWIVGLVFALAAIEVLGDGMVSQLFAGFIGGVVGSATLVRGCAVYAPSLRGVLPKTTTVAAGGALGLLAYPSWEGGYDWLLLFPFWQAGVGACLGYWLKR